MFVRCEKCWFVFYSRPSGKTLEKFQQTPKPNWDLKFKMTSANWTNGSLLDWSLINCFVHMYRGRYTKLYYIIDLQIYTSRSDLPNWPLTSGFVQLKSLLIYMLWVLVSLLSLECWNFIIYTLLTLGENRHATVTLADKLIVTDIDVSRSGTWFPVPKYNGTNASQITHVVYMVKPVHFAVISRFLVNVFAKHVESFRYTIHGTPCKQVREKTEVNEHNCCDFFSNENISSDWFSGNCLKTHIRCEIATKPQMITVSCYTHA